MVKKKALTDTGNFTKCWNIAGSFTAQKISVLLPLKYWLGVNREEYRPSGAAGQRSTASFRVQRIKQAHFWPAVLCYWMLQWARCLTLVANRHTRTHSQKHPMYPTVVVVILFIYCSETPTSLCNFLTLRLGRKKCGCFYKNSAWCWAQQWHQHQSHAEKNGTSWLLLSKPVPFVTFRTPPSFLSPLRAREGAEYQIKIFTVTAKAC